MTVAEFTSKSDSNVLDLNCCCLFQTVRTCGLDLRNMVSMLFRRRLTPLPALINLDHCHIPLLSIAGPTRRLYAYRSTVIQIPELSSAHFWRCRDTQQCLWSKTDLPHCQHHYDIPHLDLRHWKVIFIGRTVEDSPQWLAGEQAP